MSKFFKKFTLLLVFMLVLFLNPMHINASSEHFYHIKASVGENATSAGINWHTDLDGSELYLSVNSDMSNATKQEVEQRTYSKGMTNAQSNTIFAERYVCSSNLTDLELNTKYYYQIVKGEEKSIIGSFKTANSNKTTFGVLCDTQASGDAFQYSNKLVEKLYSINNDINFFMIAGDIVDRGGYESEWHALDQYMTSLSHQFLQATIPGNHELYHSSLASYEDASIYNQFFNNPKNGFSGRLNSSYYFKYNDTLFIMLDTMNRSNADSYYPEQVAWFKEVVSNNPSKFIVVVSHPGCYSTGVYASDASKMKGIWRNVFEEYGVDLAISGHEHVYARTPQIYQDKEDTERGVTYVIGGGAGAKRYSGDNDGFFAEVINGANTDPVGFYAGSIVEIVDDTLTFKFYNYSGELLDEFSIKSKVQDTSDFNIDTFLDNVHVEFNENNNKNYIVWDKNAYGNIKNISVFVEWKNTTVEKFCGPATNEIMVADGSPIRDYKYICTFTDYEGNEYEKVIEVINDPEPLKPKDFVINITETAAGKYSVDISYDINKGVYKFLFLNIGEQRVTILSNNTAKFNYSGKLTEDDIEVQFIYTLLGTEVNEIIPNEKITFNIELLTSSHTHTKCPICDLCTAEDCDGEESVRCAGHEDHLHVECPTCGLCTSPDCNGEESVKCQGHKANSGMSCNFGTYFMASLISAAALFLLIFKRK